MNGRRLSAAKALARGVLGAAAATLLGMLLLTGAIILTGMGDGAIRALNQLLKTLAVILGTYLGVGRGGRRGLATGVGVGAVYAVTGYIIFILLDGSGFILTQLLGEILISTASGAASGAIFANLKPARRKGEPVNMYNI